MDFDRELKADTVLYLKMKDGESKEEAMERMMEILSNTELDYLTLEKSYCEVREGV